ncbi:MAG: acyl-CoA reductase, partial [Bacteroidota bacterium]
MTTTELIRDLAAAGRKLGEADTQDFLCTQANRHNGWFTPQNTKKAIQSILPWLEPDALQQWIADYRIPSGPQRTVGVVAAGNIPMAGLHDALAVLVSGYRLNIKLSSQDDQLIPFLFNQLFNISDDWRSRISVVEQVRGCDAVIATGSNNTARYFEYYFRHIPLLLRRNRNSAAVVTGNETDNELKGLADDILQYFGLGC